MTILWFILTIIIYSWLFGNAGWSGDDFPLPYFLASGAIALIPIGIITLVQKKTRRKK